MKALWRLFQRNPVGRLSYLAGLFGVAVVMAALDVCLAPIVENLIGAAVERRMDLFVRGVVLAASAVAAACLLVPLCQWIFTRAMRRMTNQLREDVYTRVLEGPVLPAYREGETLSVLTNDMMRLEELLGDSLVRLVTQCLLAVFALSLMLHYDARVAVVVVVTAWGASRVHGHLARKAGMQATRAMAATGRFLNGLTDMSRGFALMKGFHLESRLLDAMDTENRAISDATARTSAIRGMMDVFSGLLKAAAYVSLLLTGLFLSDQTHWTLGELAAMLQLTGILTAFFFQVGRALSDLSQSVSAWSRLAPMLDLAPESTYPAPASAYPAPASAYPAPASAYPVSEAAHAMQEREQASPIAARTVPKAGEPGEACTPSRDTPALWIRKLRVVSDDKTLMGPLDFTVAGPGMTVLDGPSGSGKSTLFRVLLGLTDPTEGEVLVKGVSFRDMTREALRRKFAYLPQNAWLFDWSLLENVRAGAPDATEAQVREAAMAVGLEDVLSQTERWMEPVGPGGGHLSGGQRQRVALARALLSDADMLLLDEPTSALDAETEHKVLETLGKLAATRILLVASHRPAVLEAADHVVRMP